MGNVVVAGASRGIGLSLVEVYAEAGDRVFALCRNPGSADELNEIASANRSVTVLECDIANARSIANACSEIGDLPVDVLINVAGIFRNSTGPEDNDFDDWRESFEVMVIGPFQMTLALLPNIERAKGKVMSLSSQAGASTWQLGGMYSYTASKAALNRAMRSLAFDMRERGVAVGLVHPGYVLTDMGGPDAEITARESAEGIRNVIDALSLENAGGFWNWNGEPHAW